MLDSSPHLTAMLEDLARSGLDSSDLNARPMEGPEKAATRTSASVNGYVIPYFSIQGKSEPFYRVRLFNSEPKYKQQSGTSNHVYFPKNFQAALKGKSYVLITEGEKKAVLGCKHGFPCVALGGVDSWRNRQLTLPADTELDQKAGQVHAKLPSGGEAFEQTSSLALGLEDLIHQLIRDQLHLVIIYDADTEHGTKVEVQRAAARMGFELRFKGITFDHIRQLIIPPKSIKTKADKIGLDDYLLSHTDAEFQELLDVCLARKSAFPRYPAISEFISKGLQNSRLPRKETQQLAIAALSELDATGTRLHNKQEEQYYYFNYDDHVLYKADFPTGYNDNLLNNEFAHHLYQRFGVSSADKNFLVWLGTQFTGEAPIDKVQPYKVLARPVTGADKVIFQISDGQFATISARTDSEAKELPGLEIYDNGDKGVLFEAGQVQSIDPATLLEYYAAESAKGDPSCYWLQVLKDVRLKDREKQSVITALLYYISPWLYRWRGTQLPVEMILGEAGSGKSTLCELRLSILTGNPKLRNAPQDIRDWHASLAHAGGLHIIDNLQLADKQLRQRLSDEMCRLITEPNPSVEQRKLYTNMGVVQMPVQTVFAITAIQQPFTNSDIIQRSLVLTLDKSVDIVDGELKYDSEWMSSQLARFGGREGWLAHHLYVLHKFFTLVEKKWDPKYRASHRLINFEQAMMLMAEVFHIDNSWIPNYLSNITNASVTEADWVFQGISEFVKMGKSVKSNRAFTSADIADWAKEEEEFKPNDILINSRKLGRYMQMHKTMLATVLGVVIAGNTNNRQAWKLIHTKN